MKLKRVKLLLTSHYLLGDGNFNVNVIACVWYSPPRPTGSCFLLSKSMVFLKKNLVTHAFEGFVHLYTLLSRISITTPLFVLLLIQKLHEEELQVQKGQQRYTKHYTKN
jgi:hypothetical protein